MLRDLWSPAACVVADAAIGGLAISGVATALAAAGRGSPTLDAACSRLAPRALPAAGAGRLRDRAWSSRVDVRRRATRTATDAGAPGTSPSSPASRYLTSRSLRCRVGRPSRPPTVVRPGDSLWSIAARLIGSDRRVAQIAHYVADLYALNRT